MDSVPPFDVEATADGEATELVVREGSGEPRQYRIAGGEQGDYAAFFAELARDYGARAPASSETPRVDPVGAPWKALIVDNLSELTHAGYGDPAVLKVDDGWVLTATSNERRGRIPDPSFDRPGALGASRFRLSGGDAPGRHRPARRRLLGPRNGARSATNIGSPSPHASNRGACYRLGSSANPVGPWDDNGQPLITGGRC